MTLFAPYPTLPAMRFLALMLLFAGPAMADKCHDLWFTRNLVMDRAGYCFGSNLGQAQFSNADCLGKSVTLAPHLQDFVARVRAEEQALACNVDTSQTTLNVSDKELRRGLDTLPVVDTTESACIGWSAAPSPLFAAISTDSRIVGYVQPGENLYFGHLAEGDWEFVIVSGPDWAPRLAGWRSGLIPAGHCADWAG